MLGSLFVDEEDAIIVELLPASLVAEAVWSAVSSHDE